MTWHHPALAKDNKRCCQDKSTSVFCCRTLELKCEGSEFFLGMGNGPGYEVNWLGREIWNGLRRIEKGNKSWEKWATERNE
ncbi:hypothetical protein H5410_059121 [Solanum commersonii]|uniref:Uncharacterized protein n=1 Tax=Solanum commersonii TaxID=4109 RepID=A0A9J5W1H8_SOLCO|nr:hypothetical protein H5410_059121 [Solanum commersonii]